MNGDTDSVSPAVRRTLYAMANELDEQQEQWDRRILDVDAHIDHSTAVLEREVLSVRRLLITLTSTVIAGIIVGVVNIVATF